MVVQVDEAEHYAHGKMPNCFSAILSKHIVQNIVLIYHRPGGAHKQSMYNSQEFVIKLVYITF